MSLSPLENILKEVARNKLIKKLKKRVNEYNPKK